MRDYQTIILMCGIPASGKSTFVKNEIAKNPGAVWVSRDEVRKSLVGDGDLDPKQYFSRETEVFNKFIGEINSKVNEKYKMIFVDATHISPQSRAKTLSRIKNTRKLNLNVVYLKCGVQVALARNHARTGFAHVPDNAIRNMAQRFEEPTYEEFWKYHFHNVTIFTNN